jgi:hypothetical protein
MFLQDIDCKSVDDFFRQRLSKKQDKNIVKGRVDIEHISLTKKSQFIYDIISSFNAISGCTYRILFWEKNEIIESFFKLNFPKKEYIIYQPYKNKKSPGICFVRDLEIDKMFFKMLINNHFNFELAKNPSLCVRVQMYIYITGFKILLDIYDDRGFYLFWKR